MKTKIVATKNFVVRHRVAIAITATAVASASVIYIAMKDANEQIEDDTLTVIPSPVV